MKVCSKLLGTAEARRLRKLAKLRNALAHYQTFNSEVEPLTDPLAQVVKEHSGISMTDVDGIVDCQLEEMSIQFRELMPRPRFTRPL